MSRAEMLATFFVHDENGWRLKGHAHEAFYRWLATWGMFLRRPSDLGFEDAGYHLPPLVIEDVLVSADRAAAASTCSRAWGSAGFEGAWRPGGDSLGRRVRSAPWSLVASAPGPWLVWCGLNHEQDRLARRSTRAMRLGRRGRQRGDKQAAASRRSCGAAPRVLVSKAAIAGFGLNLQHCPQMLFLGLGDSPSRRTTRPSGAAIASARRGPSARRRGRPRPRRRSSPTSGARNRTRARPPSDLVRRMADEEQRGDSA